MAEEQNKKETQVVEIDYPETSSENKRTARKQAASSNDGSVTRATRRGFKRFSDRMIVTFILPLILVFGGICAFCLWDITTEGFNDDTITTLILAFSAGLLVLLLLSSIVSYKVVKPIKDVTAATKKIAEGNYLDKIKVTSCDEIGQLCEAVNTALDTVAQNTMYDEYSKALRYKSLCLIAERILKEDKRNKFAVLCVQTNGLSGFAEVHGQDELTVLLRYITSKLNTGLPEGTLVGKVSAEQYCCLVPYVDTSKLSNAVMLCHHSIKEYPINYNIEVKTGICLVGDRTMTLQALFDRAALALLSAAGNAMATVAYYDEKNLKKVFEDKELEGSLSEALQSRQLFVQIQPKFQISSRKIVGAEALVRWKHPTKGLIRPDRFIPLMEKNGLIVKLDRYIWEEGCKVLAEMKRKKWPLIPVSVNVSRQNMLSPSFIPYITELVKRYDLPPKVLELEFTESALFTDVREMYAVMARLKKLGFRIAMDDFGSGYSSLNMLQEAPIDVIKLDKDFFKDAIATPRGKIIIQKVVSMIKDLNMEMVAEGIEDDAQAKMIYALGCNVAQGYLYSKPVNVSDFYVLYRTNNK